MPRNDLGELRNVFQELTDRKGWGSFQTPRNMTLALTGHVGNIARQLQFSADDAVVETPDELRSDVASCLVYLVALSDALGIDVIDAAVADVRSAVAADRAAGSA